jgi:hypothetical protein
LDKENGGIFPHGGQGKWREYFHMQKENGGNISMCWARKMTGREYFNMDKETVGNISTLIRKIVGIFPHVGQGKWQEYFHVDKENGGNIFYMDKEIGGNISM